MTIIKHSERHYEEDEHGNVINAWTEPTICRCICGKEFEIYDPFATPCPVCNREYNGCGQMLAPRSQWGEETGERF